MAPDGKDLSEDLKKRIVALHKDDVATRRLPSRDGHFCQFLISIIDFKKD